MAVRGLTTDKVVIDVITKGGKKYTAKDITEKPFGEYERVVSFWDGNEIIMIPLENVKECRLYEE